jgi:hypothetical protein
MLVKDRWVGPCEQVLNVQKVGFIPTASMVVLGEKLGMDPWISQLSCCGLGWKPFFLGAVALVNSVDDYIKGCYALTV